MQLLIIYKSFNVQDIYCVLNRKVILQISYLVLSHFIHKIYTCMNMDSHVGGKLEGYTPIN